MAIVIYTYRDPYNLDKEPFWEEIKSCPYFCVSQTLVNGLKGLYKNDFFQGRVTTVQNLINNLYSDWESTAGIVKQHTDIDNIIELRNRFVNVDFGTNTIVHRIYCKNTIEESELMNEKPNHLITIKDFQKENISFDKNSGEIIL